MPISSNVDDALREPAALLVLSHFEFGAGSAFHFDPQLMLVLVYRFSPCLCAQSVIFDVNFETAKEHSSRGHFVDKRIQPIDQQQLMVLRVACHFYLIRGGD